MPTQSLPSEALARDADETSCQPRTLQPSQNLEFFEFPPVSPQDVLPSSDPTISQSSPLDLVRSANLLLQPEQQRVAQHSIGSPESCNGACDPHSHTRLTPSKSITQPLRPFVATTPLLHPRNIQHQHQHQPQPQPPQLPPDEILGTHKVFLPAVRDRITDYHERTTEVIDRLFHVRYHEIAEQLELLDRTIHLEEVRAERSSLVIAHEEYIAVDLSDVIVRTDAGEPAIRLPRGPGEAEIFGWDRRRREIHAELARLEKNSRYNWVWEEEANRRIPSLKTTVSDKCRDPIECSSTGEEQEIALLPLGGVTSIEKLRMERRKWAKLWGRVRTAWEKMQSMERQLDTLPRVREMGVGGKRRTSEMGNEMIELD
ncbi:hypothetical protein MMC24_002422 [Lignoscripta atroalba]|nr:hypothetical protein [Lignoscripta atroalba]